MDRWLMDGRTFALAAALSGALTLAPPTPTAAVDPSDVCGSGPVVFAVPRAETPSALVATSEVVRLDEPQHDPTMWAAFLASAAPAAATAAPLIAVDAVASASFVDATPDIAAFIAAYRLDADATNAAIARMAHGETAAAAADRFLLAHPELWTSWVPAGIAARVEASLSWPQSAAASPRKRKPVSE